MKQANTLVVTPGKLLTPIRLDLKPKNFKPIHDYLRNSRINKRAFKQNLPRLDEIYNMSELNPLDLSEINMNQSGLTQRYSKLNKSCKIKKRQKTHEKVEKNEFSENLIKRSLDIPHLNYRNYEKLHLPSVKNKVLIKTYSPKPLPVNTKEPVQEEIVNTVINLPLRVEISEHSKEYSEKIHRVHQVMKMIEIENSY